MAAIESDTVLRFPLSFPQRQFFFLEALNPGAPAHCLPALLVWKGVLVFDVLKAALQDVVNRHECLRTRVIQSSSGGEQVFDIDVEIPIELRDHSASDAVEDEQWLLSLPTAPEAPFDLAKAPLMRVVVHRRRDDLHAIVMMMHHIITDGWSTALVISELGKAYEDRLRGRLQDAAISTGYRDFIARDRAWLDVHPSHRGLAYWRSITEGAPAAIRLPPPRARLKAGDRGRGGSYRLALGAPLSRDIRACAQGLKATVFTVCVALAATLLMRLSTQDEVVVGVPFANRKDKSTWGVAGCFVNVLPLRVSMATADRFSDVVRRVSSALIKGTFYQEVPFERVVADAAPERSGAHNPLFQVLFNHADLSKPAHVGEAFSIERRIVPNGGALFDLELYFVENRDEIVVHVTHDLAAIDKSTVERWMRYFVRLGAAATVDRDRKVLELPFIGDRERQELLTWANHDRAKLASQFCIHELFAERVRASPDSVALRWQGEDITYGRLNADANRLAHHLIAAGVGPETIVALCVERSPRLIVGILAILKAGGAYLPLEPSYPRERLAFMLADAKPAMILAEEARRNDLPETSLDVFFLDLDWSSIADLPIDDPATEARPSNLAYCLYTSGSTGQPKGVLVTHANVTRLFEATEEWFSFGPTDVWTLFHSFAFDFSVWEIFGALLYGGRLVIVPFLTSRTPESFYDLLRREGVTVLNQTPSAFRQLMPVAVDRAKDDRLRALRMVIFGGEALNIGSLGPWFAEYGDRRPLLVNMYGITETTVHVTYRPLRKDDLDAPAGSVIGVPIPDLSLYVLDRALQLVPAGVVGELYVSGGGVTRGYYGRPELTAERFITNPYSGDRDAKLFKTGDLARYRYDGDIEYIGRADSQVKLRGHRIELGEIESCITSHPHVAAAVVLLDGQKDDEARLVAWVVPRNGTIDADDLRTYLTKKLPSVMVPAEVISIERLPLTENGKLDRAKLPLPSGRRELRTRYRAPRSAREKLLAAQWGEVLKVDRVGIEDNFFSLGGDSLRAVDAVRRARHAGIPVSVAHVFEQQTIAGIVRSLEAQSKEEDSHVGAPHPVYEEHGEI